MGQAPSADDLRPAPILDRKGTVQLEVCALVWRLLRFCLLFPSFVSALFSARDSLPLRVLSKCVPGSVTLNYLQDRYLQDPPPLRGGGQAPQRKMSTNSVRIPSNPVKSRPQFSGCLVSGSDKSQQIPGNSSKFRQTPANSGKFRQTPANSDSSTKMPSVGRCLSRRGSGA